MVSAGHVGGLSNPRLRGDLMRLTPSGPTLARGRSRTPKRTLGGAAATVALVLGAFAYGSGVAPVDAQVVPDDGFVDLFNGVDLEGWYTWTASQGKNNDTEGVFDVVDGEIRLLDIPVTGEDEAFGYFATNDEYADYHLRFEYQWGEKKFAPRENLLRDSGLLYSMQGPDRIWPTSVESQVQEGDTGDYFFLAGPAGDSEVAPGTNRYQAGGEPRVQNSGSITASEVADNLDGWNTSEVIVRGNSSVHIVNGVVVNRSFNHTLDGDPLTSGKIAFQVEGAEISYRNIEIKDLSDETGAPRVLAYSGTAGFRHASIPTALDALDDLAAQGGFDIDRSEDPTVFSDANLANYDAVVFVSTTGDFLNDEQERAFEQYIRGGGAYVGIHAATDAEYDWDWYGELAGASFARHPATQEATIDVEDPNHPSTEHLGDTWVRTDEWYDFSTNPRDDVNVLLTLDESTYTGGGMGDDHPIAWFHEFDGGRSWYTAGGHTSAAFGEPDFRQHLLGGITWAIDADDNPVDPIDPIDPPNDGSLDPTAWTFTTSSAQASAPNAVDGDITTRWSTGTKQAPGQFFQIDLGTTQTFDRIELATDESQPFDGPRGYEVYASNDPTDFGEPIATGTGDALTVIELDTTTAQHIRITQTGNDAFRWWSIYELDVSAS